MIKTYILSLICSLYVLNLQAEITLPKLVNNQMVLQRDNSITIWGWANTGAEITVNFKRKKYRATTNHEGKWSIQMPPLKAGGPHKMTIKGDGSDIQIKDIMIGDVWLCTGQSNMDHNFGRHQDRFKNEIATCDYPEIRQFWVPRNPQLEGPVDNIPFAEWKIANAKNLLDYSVVSYFFGKEIHVQHDVPIGLIISSYGGTPIEAWTSEKGLREFPKIIETLERNKDTEYVNGVNEKAKAFNSKHRKKENQDKGLLEDIHWYEPIYDASDWDEMNVPGYWEDQGIRDLNGTVWFRKEVNVPESMINKTTRIHMGRIIDADKIYVNGTLVGNKTYQYPQRRYDFDAGILVKGKNTIVVQVTNYGGKGGFVPDKPYHLAAGKDTLDLSGSWKYKIGEVFAPRKSMRGISSQNQPSALFNGMLAPLTDMNIKGVVWYQGESNAGRPVEYGLLLPAFIKDLRSHWKNPNLPFIYAQLPNFREVNYLPEESNWATLRQSQLNALQLHNTAMGVNIDLGEWNDIHPGNKQPVGHRLALAARHMVYGEKDLVHSGPIFSSLEKDGDKLILSFDHVGSGLASKNGEPLKWFAIAGEDKSYIWAKAEIKGNNVVLSNEQIPNPIYVRYAWMDNPKNVNFYNKEGLPASPFEASTIDTDELWHGKHATVVLTYDDALEVHLDNVIPALDDNGFKGTFYLSGALPGTHNRINDWRKAAANGHELGNHTIYHPCNGEGRDWVQPEKDLSSYTTARFVNEVETMNVMLKAIDGQSERTFAYTCGDTRTGDGSFIEDIDDMFVAMRGVHGKVNSIENVNLKNVYSFVADGKNADQFIEWAEKTKAQNGMMVILFHGVGGGHNLNTELIEHNKFIEYLKQNQKDYWVTTMLDAANHCISQKSK